VVGGDAQFFSRTEHAEGFDAAQFGFLERLAADRRTDAGEGGFQAGAGVRGTADDLIAFAAVGDGAQLQFVGVGVLFGGGDFTDHQSVEVRAERFDTFDFDAGENEFVADTFDRVVDVDVVREPGEGEFHGEVGRFQ